MTFTLTINTDGAAFGETPYDRASQIVRIIDRQITPRLFDGETARDLRDSNGNTVGSFEFKEIR